ncbi:farnesyl-diphosphate synthase [Hasllibacter halocynthiae]|uniref:Geranylgeranyl diphosphate synthase n=1 Tax=Hasllibacter halocynthiae TaxID=595589 RepID=A0A2T0X349_9RHOB|nr:polyprenyl synthetase family protein [Hasllibacter halocynthiae]PRY93376.1 farnesyl-diphosphate synthase [Hasllibacter halocynthiae]
MDAVLAQAAARARGDVGARLAARLAGAAPALASLEEACRHALEGGKRLRGLMVLESAGLWDVPEEAALPAAAAIEALHAYSLVHDDLPAMDDDELRRGRPTVHVAFGEATAILVGDALQALAFEEVAAIRGVPAERALALSARLAAAAGLRGMVGGQHWDLTIEAGAASGDLRAIAAMQALKTGALFEWSATAGAVLAGEDPKPLAAYAHALGRAFQIADDLLDATGDAATVGKATGKDLAAGKATYVGTLGVEGARAEAGRLAAEACDALAPFGARGDTLRLLARYTVSRDH